MHDGILECQINIERNGANGWFHYEISFNRKVRKGHAATIEEAIELIKDARAEFAPPPVAASPDPFAAHEPTAEPLEVRRGPGRPPKSPIAA